MTNTIILISFGFLLTVITLIKEKKVPTKLVIIKYLCMNYKEMIYSKLSTLN